MRRIIAFAVTFLALAASSQALADTQTIKAYEWIGTNDLNDATHVSTQSVTLASSGSQYPSSYTFQASPPRGYRVDYWAWSHGGVVSESKAALRDGKTKLEKGQEPINAKYSWVDWRQSDSASWTWDLANNDFSIATCGVCPAIGVKFVPISYRISFQPDGGTGVMAPISVPDYFVPTNLTKNAFVRSGYSFAGWATNETSRVPDFEDGQSVTGDSFEGLSYYDGKTNVTLTACWTANVYTVSFDANGGTVSPTQKQVTFNAAYGDLPTPDLAGHEFGGWYTAKTGGSQITATSTMSSPSNQTLYAQWGTKSYTISGRTTGTGSGSVQGVGTSIKYGTEIELRAEANTGSEFKGWTDGESANPRTVTVTSNATYTAIFDKKVYEVTFSFKTENGGDTNVICRVSHGGAATPPEADIWIGHKFIRWDPQDHLKVERTYVAVAQYEEFRYTIHYDGNGGTCKLNDNTSVLFTQNVVLQKSTPETVSRDGYVFLGWSMNPNATTPVYKDGETVNGLSAKSGGTATLYAVWDPISYVIAFDAAGGEGTMDPMTNILYDVVTNLTPNAFTKPGCEFLHWERKETGEAYEIYQDGAAVSNLTTNACATVTLTAVWDAPYWVKFEPNGGEGKMAVQRFEINEPQNLASNAFTRTGYSFNGWATNGVTTVVFTNGAELTNAFPVGTTNALSAVWSANTYTVTYAPGATDTTGAMEPQEFKYDEAQLLKSCSYQRDLWRFIGWSNTVSHVFFSTNEIATTQVSNLTAEANGVVPMVAIWESSLSIYSIALDCDNLNWENIKEEGNDFVEWCVTNVAPHCGTTCVVQPVEGGDSGVGLCARIRTNGTLTFWWKPTNKNALLFVGLREGTNPNVNTLIEAEYAEGKLNEWNTIDVGGNESVTLPIRLSPGVTNAVIQIKHLYKDAHDDENGYLYIDDVTWTPEGGTNPEPGEGDGREVTSLSMTAKAGSPTEKVLSLSFSGDARFDYRLLSSDTLLPPDWQPIGDPISGETGKSALEGGAKSALGEGVERILTFTVPMDPEKPQRFFKIETLQKK